MNIYEKTGDFLLDLAKLVVGAVILGGIMSEGFNTYKLYLLGGLFTSVTIIVAYVLFKKGNKNKIKE
ncbi:MAG: hypothetical protein LBU91_03375 [Bacteroidales bacterium]|jgi:hypothetical protein|nr:hypothetical protein [Bacteroidales bacterium]